MTRRLKAVVGLTYPKSEHLKKVREAGGISKLSKEELAKIKFKRVESGGWCDDLPIESREHYISSGKVKIVEQSEEKALSGRRRTRHSKEE